MFARSVVLASVAVAVAQASSSHSHVKNAASLNRTNWEAEEQITDAATECSAYDYPPVTGTSERP